MKPIASIAVPHLMAVDASTVLQSGTSTVAAVDVAGVVLPPLDQTA